mmetsp:Transcript_8965/g.23469  ORF Transcript_8965/g.23469 Transcript_8965/m.23469 type:complete len:236 (+) Transcript_8965:45-752(+)
MLCLHASPPLVWMLPNAFVTAPWTTQGDSRRGRAVGPRAKCVIAMASADPASEGTAEKEAEMAVRENARRRSKRARSGASADGQKRHCRCSLCGEAGHNIKRCPKRTEALVPQRFEDNYGVLCRVCRGERVVKCGTCFARGRLVESNTAREYSAEQAAELKRRKERKKQVRESAKQWLFEVKGIDIYSDELLGAPLLQPERGEGIRDSSSEFSAGPTRKCPDCGGAGWIACLACQ